MQTINIVKQSMSVATDAPLNVVIYFPTDKEGFAKSVALFKTLCCGLHFPSFSLNEMKGGGSNPDVRTHFRLYCNQWNDGEEEDRREKLPNFDKATHAFRNNDFLDFTCEAIDGNMESAHEAIKLLEESEKPAIGFIDANDIPSELPAEKELLRQLWGNQEMFEGLNADECIELKCRLEHQHWCAYKLMHGFRALDDEELKEFTKFRLKEKKPISESVRWGMHKEMYDMKRLYASMKVGAHLDICSFDELMLRDFSTVHFDLEHFEQIVEEQRPKPATKTIERSFVQSICTKIEEYSWVVAVFTIMLCMFHSDTDRIWNNSESWLSLLFSSAAFTLGIAGAIYWIKTIVRFRRKKEAFDRFLANFNRKSLFCILLLIASIPCIFAVIGCFYSYCNGMNLTDVVYDNACLPQSPNLFWAFYYQFIDPGNQHMVGSWHGLVWALPVALLGMFCLNGFLISSVVNYIERHVQNWREGKTRYHFEREKHVIIIGGHEMIVGILNQIDKPDIKRFIVMTEQSIPEYREYLCSHVDQCIAEKIVFYRGDKTSGKDIRDLFVNDESLHSIYIIGEGKSQGSLEPNHDIKNMTCATLIADNRDESIKMPLHCYVMFEHRSSYVAFQQAELPEKIKNRLLFEPFNIYEMCVQDILVYPKFPIKPIDITRFSEDLQGEKNYIGKDSERRVHLVIFGMSKVGMALASEAAVICHYPNYAKAEMLEDMGKPSSLKKEDLRTRITFIDMDAEQQMKFYQNRMPSLFEISKWKYMDGKSTTQFVVTDKLNQNPEGYEYANLISEDENVKDKNFLDVEWEFISGALGDIGVSGYLKEIAKQKNEILTIAVCLSNGEEGLSLASTMPVDVYDKAEQILVYQKNTDGIVRQMAGGYEDAPMHLPANRFGKLRPFGMYCSCFNQALLDNTLARKMYSLNYKTLKAAIKEQKNLSAIKLKDLSTLPILERWSAVYSAHNWSVKFRSMGMISGELPSKEVLKKELSTDKGDISNSRAEIWGRVEHNRWNLERLIKIGERPVGITEISYIEDGKTFKESFKKSAKRSHLDICSMEQLKKDDKGVDIYDIERNYRLVEIYEAL